MDDEFDDALPIANELVALPAVARRPEPLVRAPERFAPARTPVARESFRRSEAYLAGQIARAVARGQRVL